MQVLPIVGYTITLGIGAVMSGVFLFLTKRYRLMLILSLLWMGLFIGKLSSQTYKRKHHP